MSGLEDAPDLGQDKKGDDADETTPLMSASKSMHPTLHTYATHDGIADTEGQCKAYNVEDVITLRVFGMVNGTVFQSKSLWAETGMMGLLYWSIFGVLYAYRWEHFSEFVGKEANIRAFIAMFSTLIGLLLSFYTALNLGRWWSMRMAVRDVQEGCKKLVVMLAHGVTSDEEVLDTVQRYARASLYLLFACSQPAEDFESPRIATLQAGFITQEESDMLQQLNPHMTFIQAETLWAWLANIVTRLHAQGLSAGAPHYCSLIAAVEQGRCGVSTIQTYLETPIPLGYVHMLCWMVKLHNIILTILMALSSVKLADGPDGFDEVGVFRTGFRAFFMPFLYNAILILNSEVTDPFGGDVQDFDAKYFDVEMKMAAKTFAKAADIIPKWVKDGRKFKPWITTTV